MALYRALLVMMDYRRAAKRPRALDDVLFACLGTSRRRIDEVPAVDAFVELISL